MKYRCYILDRTGVIQQVLCIRFISRVLHLGGIRAGIRSLMGHRYMYSIVIICFMWVLT